MTRITVNAIVAMLAVSACAENRFAVPVADDLPSGLSLEMAIDLEKMIEGDTNKIARMEAKLAEENKAAKLRNVYEALRQLEPQLDEVERRVAEEKLTDVELAELSALARRYYDETISRHTNALVKIQKRREDLEKGLTREELAGYDGWKRKQADEAAAREAEAARQQEECQKAWDEIRNVRRKHRPRRRGRWMGGYHNVTDPDYCFREMDECDEQLNAERKHLAALERLTQEQIAGLSPMAQKKLRELLDECKAKIESGEGRLQELENIRVAKKWVTREEWKKQRAEKKKEERRKERQDSLARDELRAALRNAAESAKGDSDEDDDFCCWF